MSEGNDKRRLPEGWKWVRLEEVCDVAGGSTPGSGVAEYWGPDVTWITPTDLGQLKGRWIERSSRTITETGLRSCGAEIVPRGSVVLSSRAPIGHLGIAAKPLCTNQGCKTLVPGPDIDSEFLYFALNYSVPALRALGSGATFSEVSKSQVGAFQVALPPLENQRAIASALDAQLNLVERARAAAHTQAAVIDLARHSFLREIFMSAHAKSWPLAKIAGLSTMVIDGPHVTPRYVSKGVPFLTVRNIVNRSIDLRDVSYVSEEDHRFFSKRGRAEVGDILYTKDGTLGIPCVVRSDFEFSFFVSVALIKLNKAVVDPEFVALGLESPSALEQVKRLGAGAGLKHMVLKSILALEVPIPSLSSQREIVGRWQGLSDGLSALTASAERQLQTLKLLQPALLRTAFEGGL